MPSKTPLCWCGNDRLSPFSADYLRCDACETLVLAQPPSAEIGRVREDESDFYGRSYWFSHQKSLGHPDIASRARADLPERCLYWLRALLVYKQPPGRVLEVGSGHGGFVSLLQRAGFDATGLELSPSIAELARKVFGVPMLSGPLEDQEIEPASLDAIVMMDVLEHLHEPAKMLERCFGLLAPDGVLVVQTPAYPKGRAHKDFEASEDRFLEQLKPEEHLYLLSRSAMEEMLRRVGADHWRFEPAIFSHYDMFVFASRSPLNVEGADTAAEALERFPDGRMVLALLDLREEQVALNERFSEAQSNADARLAIMKEAEIRLKQLETNNASARKRIASLKASVSALERAEAGHARQIERVRENLELSKSETNAIGKRARQLETRLAESKEENSALQQNVDASESQRRQDEQDASRKQQRLQSTLARTRLSAERLSSDVESSRTLLRRLQETALYRGIRFLGGWRWLEERQAHSERRLRRIAVDVTPLLPGGDNGGAKLMTVELIRQLSFMAPDCELVLLTSSRCHEELADLDGANLRRLCVGDESALQERKTSLWARSASEVQRLLLRGLPKRATAALKRLRVRFRWRDALQDRRVLREIDADLLFCPFTAPTFFQPGIPVVSVVYDLQHVYYPEFFSAEEYRHRKSVFGDACRLSTKIVCISNYVRDTVLANSDLPPSRVTMVPIGMPHRLSLASEQDDWVERAGLSSGRFLLCPANFWPHKNHPMLLTAFNMFGAAHPDSDLKLVCTGSADGRMADLSASAKRMGLGEKVLFPGYVRDSLMATLLRSCRAVVLPSIFEGFGMPVLEAMASGKPVLCSNVTSLPEVAGDAAIFFDPRKPQEIVSAIELLESNDELVTSLVERGRRRVESLGDARDMAREYLRVFDDVAARSDHWTQAVHGVLCGRVDVGATLHPLRAEPRTERCRDPADGARLVAVQRDLGNSRRGAERPPDELLSQ